VKELTNKFYIVKGELIANIWRIPTDDVKRCVEQEKNLYIFDPHQAFASTTYSLFELDRYKEIDSVEFPVCYLEYLPETDFVLPQIFQVLSVKLHHNWMNLGFEYFTSQSFLDFLKEIQSSEIPDYTNRWNGFVIDPYKLKGAIISEHHFPNKFHIGYALGTFEQEKPITTKAIENTLKDSKPFGWNLQNSFINLLSQGVFLFNKEFVHGIFNAEFFNATIEMLNKVNLRAVLLLGVGVAHWNKNIGCEAILFEEHPLPVLRAKREYKTDVFLKFEQLTNIQF